LLTKSSCSDRTYLCFLPFDVARYFRTGQFTALVIPVLFHSFEFRGLYLFGSPMSVYFLSHHVDFECVNVVQSFAICHFFYLLSSSYYRHDILRQNRNSFMHHTVLLLFVDVGYLLIIV